MTPPLQLPRPNVRKSRRHQPRIEPLEDRIAPATITIAGTGNADTLVINVTSGTGGNYALNGDPSQPFNFTDTLIFNGGNGADSVTINAGSGLFSPAGFTFNGGAGNDTFTENRTVTNQTVTFTGADANGKSASITVDAASRNFTGIETLNLAPSSALTLKLPTTGTNNATMQDTAVAGLNELIDSTGGVGTIPRTVFANPGFLLSVELASSGSDTLAVKTLDSAYAKPMLITGNANSNVQITGLSIVNSGQTGLLLRDIGTVGIAQSTFNDNQNGGLVGSGLGKLTIKDSTFRGNSVFGGLALDASAPGSSITGSTFEGNQGRGGIVLSSSDVNLTIENSAIVNNSASSGAGGIFNGGTLAVKNTTISGNSGNAGGGIANAGDLTLDSVTIAFNSATSPGGGIFNVGGSVKLGNSIVAKNSALFGADILSPSPIFSNDYNLIENTTDVTFAGATAHNIYGVDPQLNPLALNGGTTLNHSLKITSPAFEAGKTNLLVDQNGIARPQALAADIGAAERRGDTVNLNPAANGTTDTVIIRNNLTNQTVEAVVNGVVVSLGPAELLNAINVIGTNDPTNLIVDSSNGLILPVIFFDGGAGSDSLTLTQTGGITQDKHVYSVGPGTGDGSSVITGSGGALTQRVFFKNLEPVLDLVPAAQLIVNGTNSANQISYQAGFIPTNGFVAVDNFETIEFTNKGALVLNGLGGDDTISLNNPNTPAGLTSITVNGGDPGGNDALIVQGTAAANAVTITPTAADGATISGLGAGITAASIESLLFNGGGGNDPLTIAGTAGNDTFDYTPGLAGDAGTLVVNSLLPVRFQNLGANGQLNLADTGGTGDALVYHGSESNDTFYLDQGGSGLILYSRDAGFAGHIAVNVAAGTNPVERVLFDSLGGDDAFLLNSSPSYAGGVIILAGTASNDRVFINGTLGADTISLFSGSSAGINPSTDSVTGVFAGEVRLIGVEELTLSSGSGNDNLTVFGMGAGNTLGETSDLRQVNAFAGGDAGDSLTVFGSLSPGFFEVTPESSVNISVTANGSGTKLLANLHPDAIFSVAGGSSKDIVTVHGSSAGETIAVVKGSETTVQVGALKSVRIDSATVEQVNVLGGDGADTFNVSGTAANGQGLTINGGVPTSNAGAFSDLVNLTLATAGTTALVPGATPDSGAVTNPDGNIAFDGIEFVNVTGAAGANTFNIQGTHDNDTLAVQFLGGANRAWVNGRNVASFSNFATVNVNALFGGDTVNILPVDLVGVTTINVAGGDPTAGDKLIVNGTSGNDTIGYTPSSTVGSGSVAVTGAPTVIFTTIEALSIDGQGGTDALTVTNTVPRRVTYTPGSAPDEGLIEVANFGGGTGLVPLSFAHLGATGSVTFAGSGDILQLNGTNNSDTFNVTGTTAQIINATGGFVTMRLNLTNISQTELRGLAGSDTFNLSGNLAALSGGVVVDGGAGASSDTANLSGATAAVAVEVLSDRTAVAGYGTTVTLRGIALLNADATGQTATFNGTAGNEIVDVTPTGNTRVAVRLLGENPAIAGTPVVNFTNPTGLLLNGGGGIDSIALHGTAAGDTFELSRASAGPTLRVNSGVILGTTSAFHAWKLNNGAGDDTVVISEAGSIQAVQIDIDGGSGSDSIVLETGFAQIFTPTGPAAGRLLGGAPVQWTNVRTVGVTSLTLVNAAIVGAGPGDNRITVTGNGPNSSTVSVDGGTEVTFDGAINSLVVDGQGGRDTLDIPGTAAADTFTFAGIDALNGTVTVTGFLPVSYAATETTALHGLAGSDTFKLASAKGAVTVIGGEDSDTVDFTGATGGVTIDLDAPGEAQLVNTTGQLVTLSDSIENFIGTAFNDILKLKVGAVDRTVFGGVQVVTPPGDVLIVDARGAIAKVVPVDFNTGTVATTGYGDVDYDEFEGQTVNNSPGGPSGFGTPSNSDAFADAHVYDSLQFRLGGKPAPGRGPSAVATGDLTGDGYADMVLVNSKSKNLSVLINKGDGTFFDPVNLPSVVTNPQDLVLGDFNNDGNLDAVVTYPGSGRFGFFAGTGMGSFVAPVITSLKKFRPFAIAAADLDGDADLDLAITSRDSNTIAIMRGNNTGSFDIGTPVKTLGKQPVDIVIADFNNDGALDLATANGLSNDVNIFRGDGAGGVGTPVRFATGLRPSGLAAADIDLDGDIDLAVTNVSSRFVSVLLSRGNVAAPADQFAPQLKVALAGVRQPSSIVIGDFDGDGKADLGLGNRLGTKFTIMRGLGLGVFSQPYDFELGKDPRTNITGGVALADFNNDGLLDIAATSLASNDVRVLLRKI